jgi:hypothetical protein
MAAGVGVGGCVTLRGVVATADVAALEADPQVEPQRSFGQAVLTAGNGLRQLGDLDVSAMPALDHPL